jgi:hypothetical protein
MDCSVVSDQLIAYHFGTLAEAEKGAVEEHLLGCPACLRAALVLKVGLERGSLEADGPRPSEWARQKLRAEVERTFKTSAPARARAWFQRPIPLYQGLCAAAVAILVGAFVPRVFGRDGAPHAFPRPVAPATGAAAERIDTSRTAPESLTIY